MARRLLLLLAALALPACESPNERLVTDPPRVLVARLDERLPLAVTPAGALRDTTQAAAFIRTWRDSGWGPLTIDSARLGPEARSRLKSEVVTLARRLAADPSRIVVADGGAVAELRFGRASAILPDCTPDIATAADFPGNPGRSFGCTTRRNLGAMIANPADLVDPKLDTPADASRGEKVVENYRKGPAQAPATSENAIIIPLGKSGK